MRKQSMDHTELSQKYSLTERIATVYREILLKVGSLVKPIMKNHNWKVGTLSEFLPNDPSLLGKWLLHSLVFELILIPGYLYPRYEPKSRTKDSVTTSAS